ncbi:MAG: hypothetical protein M3R38_12145 [Actinomycetota bacterium]|nr:hypothetical protein [Actinomycetota bacterium]
MFPAFEEGLSLQDSQGILQRLGSGRLAEPLVEAVLEPELEVPRLYGVGLAVPLDLQGRVGLPVRGVEEVGLLAEADEHGTLSVWLVRTIITLGGIAKLGGSQRQEVVLGVPSGQILVDSLILPVITKGEVDKGYFGHVNDSSENS